MSFLDSLCRVYENNPEGVAGVDRPVPAFHTTQNAHIAVALDGEGNFLSARVIPKEECLVMIPVTEQSAGRTSKPVAHPLFDKLVYTAGDFTAFGGAKSGYAEYVANLEKWCASSFAHPKVEAVLRYVRRGTLCADLAAAKILPLDAEGRIAAKRIEGEEYPLFSVIATVPADAFVVFECRVPGDPAAALWMDPAVQKSWAEYCLSSLEDAPQGLCFISGEPAPLAVNHPKRIRHGADGAKLISSNDTVNFTYRGMFTEADQACGISVEVTQKAHNALRWLIGRQRHFYDSAALVLWAEAAGCPEIPVPLADTAALLRKPEDEEKDGEDDGLLSEDGEWEIAENLGSAEASADALKRKIRGYAAVLNPEKLTILMIDAATPGTMAVKFCRELAGSEFLARLEAWHLECRWELRLGKDRCFWGTPSVKTIAQAAYGTKYDPVLLKKTAIRLLPCVLEGQRIPPDLERLILRRTVNYHSLDPWEFNRNLGVFCALFRCNHKEGGYEMALETDRTTRDYLYGRLLAVADQLEGTALRLQRSEGSTRATNAMRYLQRFAERPYSTWLRIELSLKPYRDRLIAQRPGLAVVLQNLQDEIFNLFETEKFISDKPLSGEFLLGFHCQRAEFFRKKENAELAVPDENDENDEING
ncbi:MAG: type I-C CRISPR-associated protein Cas8c/Csd1 [Lentisphaeria bacterium]|nr:type I-C CRISPR-associated protein Cas8c/Csd1 [Lentisphaeria bacterium]